MREGSSVLAGAVVAMTREAALLLYVQKDNHWFGRGVQPDVARRSSGHPDRLAHPAVGLGHRPPGRPSRRSVAGGPVGQTRGVGPDYFDKWAAAENLTVTRRRSGNGLLPSFAALSGPGFEASAVAPPVAEFYERAADFQMDVWSESVALFRPFGFLVAALFSRRLEQLNLPLSSLDTSWGMTSEVVRVTDPSSGEVRANAWVRTLVKTGQVHLRRQLLGRHPARGRRAMRQDGVPATERQRDRHPPACGMPGRVAGSGVGGAAVRRPGVLLHCPPP